VGLSDVHAATVLLLQSDIGLVPIQTNAKAFQLTLDDALVSHWLLAVEHDQNESASSGDTNDLLTATFTVFGTFNDTWQVKQLNFGTAIVVDTRYTSQRRELIVGRLGELACELCQ
jgi:hypothetical protein